MNYGRFNSILKGSEDSILHLNETHNLICSLYLIHIVFSLQGVHPVVFALLCVMPDDSSMSRNM
jgi:hypothetical protein